MKRYEKPILLLEEIELNNIILTSEEEPVEEMIELPDAVLSLGNVDWKSMWDGFES